MSHEVIRVLHYNYCWLPLTESWLYDLIRFLPASIRSSIVCRKRDHPHEFFWPEVHSGSLTAYLNRQVDHAEILHSHFGDFGWRNMKLAKQVGMKHVVSFYGHDVRFLPLQEPEWRIRYLEMFRQVDRVLCEGEHMAECIVRDLGCPENKMTVHRLGIDLEQIPFRQRAWSAGEKPRFLIAASFWEKKGIPDALRAISLACRELGEAEITIIGDAAPGSTRMAPEKEKILKTIDECGLNHSTTLLGYQPHKILLNEAYRHHVFVSPSYTAPDGDTEGGAPVTLIEMAASGMPVISTAHCDIPGTLGRSNRRLLSAERDVKGLAEAIITLFDRPSWSVMLDENRRHIENCFSSVHQGRRLERIYRQLLE